MNRTKKKLVPVNLFFLELIIVLLFFSVSMTVILRMFVSADAMAKKNGMSERVSLFVQSISEMYAVSGDMQGSVENLLGFGVCTYTDDGSCEIYLDEYMNPLITQEGKDKFGRIKLHLAENTENGICGRYSEMEIGVCIIDNEQENEIYSQKSSAYIPDTGRSD